MLRSWIASVVLLGTLGSACKTTSPSREPPVATLSSQGRVEEFERDTVTSQGDLIEKGTKVIIFEGFFADGERIDELTLYHLAGDTARRDEIIEYGKQYNLSMLAGWSGSALGVGLVAAGATMFALLGTAKPEEFVATPTGQLSFGLMSGGGLVLATAPVAAFFVLAPKRSLYAEGNGSDINEEHVFPLADADEAIAAFKERQSTATAPTAAEEAPRE